MNTMKWGIKVSSNHKSSLASQQYHNQNAYDYTCYLWRKYLAILTDSDNLKKKSCLVWSIPVEEHETSMQPSLNFRGGGVGVTQAPSYQTSLSFWPSRPLSLFFFLFISNIQLNFAKKKCTIWHFGAFIFLIKCLVAAIS